MPRYWFCKNKTFDYSFPQICHTLPCFWSNFTTYSSAIHFHMPTRERSAKTTEIITLKTLFLYFIYILAHQEKLMIIYLKSFTRATRMQFIARQKKKAGRDMQFSSLQRTKRTYLTPYKFTERSRSICKGYKSWEESPRASSKRTLALQMGAKRSL